MTERFADSELDACLRDVPLPAGLLARLASASLAPDDRLDAELAAVPLPPSLLARLQEIPANEALDAQLRDAPVAPQLVDRLARFPRRALARRRLLHAARELALASALLLLIGAGLGGATYGWLAGSYAAALTPPPTEWIVLSSGPWRLQGRLASPGETAWDAAQELATIERPAELQPFPWEQGDEELAPPDLGPPPPAGPVAQWVSAVERGVDPWSNVMQLRWGVLGSPQRLDDPLPEIAAPAPWLARGMLPPVARGYDRAFALRNQVFPPFSPGAAGLSEVVAPLAVPSDGLGAIRAAAAQGRWPDPRDVRVEDFLAELAPPGPLPSRGQLELRTAGGPSLFGPAGAGLLQFTVQAGLPSAAHRPTHLVIALDASALAARGRRFERAREALLRLPRQLAPHDRVSLVAFQEDVALTLERLSAADDDAWRQALERLAPRGAPNLAAGAREAASLTLADGEQSFSVRRLVLLAHPAGPLPADEHAQLAAVLAAVRQAGVSSQIIDLAGDDEPSPDLERLAAAGAAELLLPADPPALAQALARTLWGDRAVLAEEAQLTLKFRPQAVSAYRLIGHEPTPLSLLSGPAVAVDLLPGQSAAALVELWLRDNAEDDLGQAELIWRDPATGQSRRIRQRLSRLQLAPTFGACAPSLQAATLAAETAETLRGAREKLREIGVAGNAQGLPAVLEAARRLGPAASRRHDVQRLVELVEALAAARPR